MERAAEASKRDEGASAVEFALVSLILALFLLGIIQFGFTFFQYLEVVHSAREGVRWASLGMEPGSVSDSDSVRGRVAEAAPGLEPPLADGNISITETSVDGQDAVEVTVTYDSPIFLPLIGEMAGDTAFHLSSSATMREEAPPRLRR